MNTTLRRPGARRGFSIVEMLIALTISATLLTAVLGALDACFKSYKVTTESASTHVVSRIVIHRLLAMIRTGTEFGPYPADVLAPEQNPVSAGFIEFLSEQDREAGLERVTRIERRSVGEGQEGAFELWYELFDVSGAEPVLLEERPLLTNLREASFTLEYEPGPRLIRATVDLAIGANDYQEINSGLSTTPPVIRLVASASPRQVQ